MAFKSGLMFTLLFCFAVVSPCLAKQGEESTVAEIKAVVEQFDRALNAQDLKGIMTIYSSDSNTVLMGTGPGEVYVGEEGISGAYIQFFDKYKPDTISFKYDWIAVGSKGDIAWFAVTTTMSSTADNIQGERAFNVTGLLRKQKGKWRIFSMHFSRLRAEDKPAVEPAK